MMLQTLPFLKAAQPSALKPLLANGFTTIDMGAVQTFAQKTLVPMVSSSIGSKQRRHACISSSKADAVLMLQQRESQPAETPQLVCVLMQLLAGRSGRMQFNSQEAAVCDYAK
jgi:hypothetical protein